MVNRTSCHLHIIEAWFYATIPMRVVPWTNMSIENPETHR